MGESGEEQVACQYCKYLLEGAVLGDCRILRWIGSGAFGDVYEAEQLPPLSRRVAIKVMAIERVVDGESAEMFAREVSTIAALDHPNILPVLRVGMIDDGRPYLVMKYAAQGSLQQFCQPMSPAFNPPSLVPTVLQPGIAETPAGARAAVSATTLSIVETIEHTAGAGSAGEIPDAESTQVLREESPADAEPNTDTDDDQLVIPAPGEPAAQAHVSPVSSSNNGAYQETADKPADVATAEQVDEPGNEQTPAEIAETPRRAEDSTPTLTPDMDAAATPIAESASSTEETLKSATGQLVSEPTPDEQSAADDADNETARDAGNETAKQNGVLRAGEQNGHTRARETEQIPTLILASNVRPEAGLLPSAPADNALPLTLQQVLVYVEEAASALAYAHQRGLIHLDVKPANLLLDAQGRLLLADFGVSVLLEGYTHASLHYYVGTPLYTAPEQWLEQPRTASDQYALAVTCYQLLTGRPPFTGNLYAVMHGHLQATPPPMSEFNPLIPIQVEAVIRRALAKDPTERYPDILTFARALREAVETAASASTDPQMQQRVALLLEHSAPVLPIKAVSSEPELPVTTDDTPAETAVSKKTRPESGTFRARRAEWEMPGDRLRTGRGRWLRNLLLFVLALLLIAGGSLGFIRSQRPCWMGICPQIQLSVNQLTMTNDATQPVEITNRGTDTLNWNAFLGANVSWLSFSPAKGTLAPGKSARMIVKTNVDKLNLDPNRVFLFTGIIDITGGSGVATETLQVTENVAKGLSAVNITMSGKPTFLYEQNKLKPGKQTITITNKSGQTLTWFTQYTDNNWLSVTPSQGSLANQKSATLTATVMNPQKLASNIYQVHFSLVGKLDSQKDFTLLQTFDFTLQVNQSQVAQTSPTTLQASPTTPASLSFTAQPVTTSGAPGEPRFNHSMVWDTQNDQLLIFGGSNGQGGLLNDLWSFNPANNAWTNLTQANANSNASDCSGGSPAPRMNAAMVWDSTDQELLLYGGIGNNTTYLGDLWAYSPAKGTWSALACTGNAPGGRAGAGVVWNGTQMLLLGGQSSDGLLADLWAYTPGSGGWSQLTASTPLGARAYPALAWDSHDKQLFVFGGLGSNGQQLGDFYSYQPANGGWSTIEPGSNSAPLARQQALAAWDSKDRVFLLMGGWQSSNSAAYSALWAYSPSQNTWWQITSLRNSSSTSVIPSRMASIMVWDNTDNRAYIYAGSSSLNKGALNDLWMISPV
ncbi:MAG TPA: kelch repeat-containing protein [Ktedonobacteraceae bacterium]